MAKISSSQLNRVSVVAITFVIAAGVLSCFPIGPFHTLLTSHPAALQLPRFITIVVFAVVVAWALRGAYRPAQRTTIVVLGALVLSEFALIGAYLIAQFH
ncbi:hypothetical protein ACXR0O_20595 [Verrucomicrobiota bacterium sgz303538]